MRGPRHSPRVLVIGDVMVDIVVRPEGPLVLGADRRAAIRVLAGGSGANQAAWLAREGVEASFVGRVGAADHAHQERQLAQSGVHAVLAADAAVPTGTIVTLLSADGERSFFTDRAANRNLCWADLPEDLLDHVDLVHVSAYSLFDAGPRAAVLEFLAAAERRRIRSTIDAASHSFLAEAGPKNVLAWTRGAEICFANQAEAAVLAGTSEADKQLAALTRDYPLVVLKCGAAGAMAGASGGKRWSAAAPAMDALDSSGAGDAFLAAFLSRHLRGEPVYACLHAAVQAGSLAVTSLGGRPPGMPAASPLPGARQESRA